MHEGQLTRLLSALLLTLFLSTSWCFTSEEMSKARDEVREMFYHGYNNYMTHAFPKDELLPLSCTGVDNFGGYSLTLVDALDMLAAGHRLDESAAHVAQVLGDAAEFESRTEWLCAHLNFDRDVDVSVFETNIRVLGGLLSAHMLASDSSLGLIKAYDGCLLLKAEDMGRRLLRAFDTPTGIPYGTVNLRHGVMPDENNVTATAAAGTLMLEFGTLSRLTKDSSFEVAARRALEAVWSRRSQIGLVGGHINVITVRCLAAAQSCCSIGAELFKAICAEVSEQGAWTQLDSGIGTSIDSYYEYLLKSHLAFRDDASLTMFSEAYAAVKGFLLRYPWYVEVHMHSAALVWPVFNSLQAFWPGLEVLAGQLEAAASTHSAFYGVWRQFGFTPEGYNLAEGRVQHGQKSYPLRPELAESTLNLFSATQPMASVSENWHFLMERVTANGS